LISFFFTSPKRSIPFSVDHGSDAPNLSPNVLISSCLVRLDSQLPRYPLRFSPLPVPFWLSSSRFLLVEPLSSRGCSLSYHSSDYRFPWLFLHDLSLSARCFRRIVSAPLESDHISSDGRAFFPTPLMILPFSLQILPISFSGRRGFSPRRFSRLERSNRPYKRLRYEPHWVAALSFLHVKLESQRHPCRGPHFLLCSTNWLS